jgi:spermidine/putrescine transport system ATP-binding protein
VTEREVAIRLVGLTRSFGELTAVDHLDLEIFEGEFFSLIGPSGCGKTTTLRMIAGLETMTSGQVFVEGKDISREPAYRRPVNTVFQQYGLFPHLNVFENVAFGLKERREPRSSREKSVRRMLDLVGLAGRERSRPRELSGGQQQRVAVARALVLNPKVLLLDEPLGALDLKLRRQMQGLLKSLQRELGITFVYVTHDQEEAFSMSDRVGVMNAGVLEQLGTPTDVYKQPKTFFVADFVGAANCLRGVVEEAGADGRYAVQLSGLSVRASGVPGIAVGENAVVLVRPEAAHLGEATTGGLHAHGSITDIAYAGPQTSYTIESNGLGELIVLTKTDSRSGLLELGQAVQVTWEEADIWVLPTGAEGAGVSTRSFVDEPSE